MKTFLLLVAIFISSNLMAQAYHEGEQTLDGYSTEQIITAIKLLPTSLTQLPDLTTLPTQGQGTLGAGVTISSTTKVANLPGSYFLRPEVEIGYNIPVVHQKREGVYSSTEEITDTSLGDISIYGTYVLTKEKFLLKSKLLIKTPTGNGKLFKDGEETRPSGTGAFDFMVEEFFTYRPSSESPLRIFGGGMFRFNGDYEYTENVDVFGGTNPYDYTFTNEYGNHYSLFLGASHTLPFLPMIQGYASLSYLVIEEGKQKIESLLGLNLENDKNDSLKATDLTLGLRYKMSEKTALKLGVTIPLKTTYDEDVVDPKDRGVISDFGMDYLF